MASMWGKGLIGRKIGMTRVFEENGAEHACTLVEVGPCIVTQRKTAVRDGYEAIQIAFEEKREKLTTQPMKGHFAKHAKCAPQRFLREVRYTESSDDIPNVGDVLTCEMFQQDEIIDVIGTMKGRGFSGVVKRHNFATRKESHGSHFFVRAAGSIGCRKPQHTVKGRRMAGQYGNTRITTQNLRIMRIDAEKNLLYIKGSIPGAPGGMIMVRESKKNPGKIKQPVA